MKDLDFDELDRAVASALGDSSSPRDEQVAEQTLTPAPLDTESPSVAPKPDTVADTPADTPASISAHAVHSRIMPSAVSSSRTTLQRKSITPDTNPTAETSSLSPSDPVAPEASVQAQPKRRIPHREGRFMDVVRSGQTTPVTSPKPPLETTASVVDTPPMPEITTVPATSTPASVETNKNLEAAINELFVSEGHAPVVSDEPTAATDVASPGLATTDETTQPSPTDLPEPEVGVSTEDDSVTALAAELGSTPTTEPPLPVAASPFLADAKVEKRPLGAAVDTSDSPEIEISSSDSDTAEAVSELPLAPEPESESENAPIPEELASDLLAIESSTPATPTQPKEDSATNSVVATGPASIARQYKESPRTASEDDESGAIFDPGTYQQPIEHPAKKSSGWGWIVAIIVIILLAVGGAVAAWLGGLLPVAL